MEVIILVLCCISAASILVNSPLQRRSSTRLLLSALLHPQVQQQMDDNLLGAIDQTRSENVNESPEVVTTISSTGDEEHHKAVENLVQMHGGRFVCINSSAHPHCDIYLCGTLHVANTSVEFVKSAIRSLKPHYVVLELCEERMDVLMEPINPVTFNHTLVEVFRSAIRSKNWKALGMDLLSWMQSKSAKLLNVKLGGELSAAAKEAHKIGAGVVLGDRKYSVTIQRIFDRLNTFEKIKIGIMFIWEALSLSALKVREYIKNTENGTQFVQDEVAQFAKYMPALAQVVIFERDEYLAQSIKELARTGFGDLSLQTDGTSGSKHNSIRKGKILAVVGAGHLEGITKHLINAPSSAQCEQRMLEISKSSRENANWPGAGMLHVVDLKALYDMNQ